MNPDVARLLFRMPSTLKRKIEHYATGNCHSLNDSLLILVKRGLAAEKAASNRTA